MGCDIMMPYRFLIGFQKTKTHSRTRNDCHVSTLRSRRDNFIGIRIVNFLNSFSIFTSLVDIGCILVVTYLIYETEQLYFL